MFVACMKEGFLLTHRNWQLVVVGFIASVIHLLGVGIFLGIPFLIAIVYLGLDIANMTKLLPSLIENPFLYASRYIELLFLLCTALILYLFFSFLLLLYVLSGTLGVLKHAVREGKALFSLSLFFKEAGGHFSGLVWLISTLATICVILVILFGFLGSIGAELITALGGFEGAVRVFITSFLTSLYIVSGIAFLFMFLLFGAFTVAISMMEETGTIESMGQAYHFLTGNPGAFIMYMVLMVVLLMSHVVFVMSGIIPFMAPLLQILLQKYLEIVLWSSLFVYYKRNAHHLARGRT